MSPRNDQAEEFAATLQAAKAAHQRGDMAGAEGGYRVALGMDGQSPAALYGLGMLMLQTERADEAAGYFEATHRIDPTNPSVLHAWGVALAVAGRTDDAIGVYKTLLVVAPKAVPVLGNLGHLLMVLGRADEALGYLQEAAALAPQSLEVQVNLSLALMALERHEEALVCHEQIVALNDALPDAHNNMALSLIALGREADAVAPLREALRLNPDFVPALDNLGNLYHKLGDYSAALECYRHGAALQPDAMLAHFYCGLMLARLGYHEEALVGYQRALALVPDYAEAHNNYGLSLAELGRHDEALAHFTRAVALEPHMLSALCNGGNALNDLGRPEEAVQWFEKALAVAPDEALAYSGIANARKYQGRFAEARTSYEKAVALRPDMPGLQLALALVDRFSAGDSRLPGLTALAGKADGFGDQDQASIFFALAKAYIDLKQPAEAMAALHRGNAAKRRDVVYDEVQAMANLARLAETFTPEFMAARAGGGDPSDLPIFVLGMPRSGTTLVEQVIASHPGVFGAGELNDLAQIVSGGTSVGMDDDFPLSPERLTPERLKDIGAAYVERLAAYAPTKGVRHITDKMPGNFRFIGLIRLALPGARIIHVRRDPRDICFSCYSILFKGKLNYTYDLGELGRRYKAYETLMDHWHAVLPPGVMLQVRYEDLVNNFEAEARRLLAFCGLDWDEHCRSFYNTERTVRTASATQVRQPLYTGSIGRWKDYADELTPLLDALGMPAE
ncbi:MAG: tetratricopeptide repeat protein [Rhizomicrobium sp.]